jgi:hypothetical protein
VKVQAVMPDAKASSEASATAISGASGGKTGGAGALAINIGMTESVARIAGDAAVVIEAQNFAGNEATAKAMQAQAGKFGVGGSLALNIGETDTDAVIEDEAVLTNARDVTLSASSKNDMQTFAGGGAGGATAITPVVAISVSNNETARCWAADRRHERRRAR